MKTKIILLVIAVLLLGCVISAAESEEAVRTLQTMPEAAIGLRENASAAEHRKMKSDPG